MDRSANQKRRWALLLLSIILVSALCMLHRQWITSDGYALAQAQADHAASAKAFLLASQVLLHPRCVNCHPEGDHPLTGDRSLPHPMNIERGPVGMGTAGLSCSGCHQEKNQPGEHTPPGAPDWHLPTRDMPMVFQNRTPRQICEHLKDPSQNGGRNLEQLLEHFREAPVVLWGWSPGDSRTPVPMPHDEFVRLMVEWITKGAACPE